MTECVAWNRMAQAGYKIRFFDDIIWICEYLEDGLTMAGFRLFANNPRGYILSQMEKTRFLHPKPMSMCKCVYSLYCDLQGYYTTRQIAAMTPRCAALIYLSALFYKAKNGKKELKT